LIRKPLLLLINRRLTKGRFETVVPSLLGPDKISDPEKAELEYGLDFNENYPSNCKSVFGLFMGSLVTARRHGPMKMVSSGQSS
jgi:hypothetical protein